MNPDQHTDRQTTAGHPWPCLLSGAVMLAVPALWSLVAAPYESASSGSVSSGAGSSGSTALALLATLVLMAGAVSVALATARPERPGIPALAVLCAALALVFAPVQPWADGLTGVAALAFLLAVRLHAAARRAPVDVEEWFTARRPMLVGAAVTTPAAIAAALVPAEWSLPVAALVGVVAAALCTAVLAT
jgi:hypothetical protein